MRAQVRDSRRARWFLWRGLAVAVVFGSGFAGFVLRGEVSDRAVAGAHLGVKLYYTLGLFVLGGLDLGTPIAGPPLAQGLLWFAYFAAPALTATAVVEGILRAVDPERWRLRRLRDHVVIGGCGRLAMIYLACLRARQPHVPIVVVEARPEHPLLPAARQTYGARVVIGDVSTSAVLSTLRVEHARRVLMLTGNDFANLDAAAKILATTPGRGDRFVVHVGDLRLGRLMKRTKVASECVIFNIYQAAAEHLVLTELHPHFLRTEFRDVLVLAGFGRLGQTVLAELQERAPDALAEVLLMDLDAEERAMEFAEEVGFSGQYRHRAISGDMDALATWQQLEQSHDFSAGAPVFVLATGDDSLNVRIALRMAQRYPNALVLARTYFPSTFAAEVSHDAGFRTFSVSELVAASMPQSWL